MRDTIFVSHANPEDNEFSRWLSLQLIRMGYPVWCDVLKLIGGEDFWRDIETSIRQKAIKFIFVLSRSSNVKEGTLQELAVAKKMARIENLHDFIVPVRIDDLPYSDINIELHRLNVISFESGWASGLALLKKKLEEDRVPTDSSLGAETVSAWWRKHFSAERGLLAQREELLSNWFPLAELPKEIYYHIRAGVRSFGFCGQGLLLMRKRPPCLNSGSGARP